MEITFNREGDRLTAVLSGRIDTNSAPLAEEKLNAALDGVNELVLDFEKVEYISSAGLRVLLLLHKTMMPRGGMTLLHANETVREVLEITGFYDILNVKES